jgi:hypothetical protein
MFWFSVNWKNQVEAVRSGGLVLAFDFSLSPGLGGFDRGQSHNSNILTRVSPEHPVVACVEKHGHAALAAHEKNGATQAIFGYG